MKNKEKGYLGEALAAEHLRSLGYEILEQNYTVRGGELDIIAVDRGTLVIVEVKARSNMSAEERPAEAVDRRKIAFLVRSAERYVLEKPEACENMPVRFDCIEVIFDKGMRTDSAHINHIKDIDVYTVGTSGASYEYF